VAIPSRIGPAYAYLAPAIALGYDREEGLDFALFYGDEPGATARGLCAGKCDIACLNTIVGFIGRAQGLPMVAIGSKARHAHRYFAVVPQSPIHSLSDLKGKTIACDFPHLHPLAEAALAEENVPRGGFQWVDWRGSGMEAGQMIEPLRRGDIDAAFIMDWNDGDFAAQGLRLRHLASKLLDRIRVSSCYWTTEAHVAADQDFLSRGLRAIQKSLVYSFENPEAALRLMGQIFPEAKPPDSSRGDITHRQLDVLKACLEPMRIDGDDPDPRWCAIPPQEMLAWQEFLRRSGIIAAEIDVMRCYTTTLVEPINDFDAAAIRAAAAQTRFI
jgi:ABC-type nitrate/sulfonate/bicarbonate transport system substrate-binding protein